MESKSLKRRKDDIQQETSKEENKNDIFKKTDFRDNIWKKKLSWSVRKFYHQFAAIFLNNVGFSRQEPGNERFQTLEIYWPI